MEHTQRPPRPRQGGRHRKPTQRRWSDLQRRRAVTVLATTLALGGGATVVTGVVWDGSDAQAQVSASGSIPQARAQQGGAPQAPTSSAPAPSSSSAAPSAPPSSSAEKPPPPLPFLPESVPTKVRMPSVGIESSLVDLGLKDDGTVEVPEDFSKAGWYDQGPTPGELGPATILGHIDSYRGPAIFHELRKLKPDEHVFVTREDGSVARFRVDAVREYPKDDFPTEKVYGSLNYAGLRLITCGGPFDEEAKSYENNTVVFATLDMPASQKDQPQQDQPQKDQPQKDQPPPTPAGAPE